MAARRVVILLLVLLVVSTLAAALVPPPPDRSSSPETTSRAKSDRRDPAARERRRGHLVVATFKADPRHPEKIQLHTGDELRMEIASRSVEQIEVPAFGLIEDASRDAPARFDLLADHRGVFEIRLVRSRRVVGRLVIR